LNIQPGYAEIEYNSDEISIQKISELLALSDLSIIKNNEEKIIEKIKISVYELIFEMNNVDSIAKKSGSYKKAADE